MGREVNVWWVSTNPGTPERGYWDQQLIEDLFAGRLWEHGFAFEHHVGLDQAPASGGAVVVIPARSQQAELVEAAIAHLPWVLLLVVGDEEHVFRWMDVRHPNMRVWVQSPDPYTDQTADGWLPVGWTPGTYEERFVEVDRSLAWSFAGQETHRRRHECVTAAQRAGQRHGPAFLLPTEGFTQGLPRAEYLRLVHQSNVVLCPSGPVTVDTFRLSEALELGAIPIADGATPQRDESRYWRMLFDEMPPFPIVDHWAELRGRLDGLFDDLAVQHIMTAAWWQRAKRSIVERMARQIRDLAGIADEPDDMITVLVSTSPIPSHPLLDVLTETIGSIRDQLPRATIILMCDGVRPEQNHLREQYLAYLGLLTRTMPLFKNVIVSYTGEHKHQAGTTKDAMRYVSTSAVLFVEHDTPLVEGTVPIPWPALCRAVFAGHMNVVRFHHEGAIHPEHRWLMKDLDTRIVAGVPVRQTMQWSQRPHLAESGFYRKMLSTYFGGESRTMIEDTMHGVLDFAWRERGHAGADEWGVFIFHPEGDIRRSGHIDGRGDEGKFDMVFEYDGTIPEGAPYPTSMRGQ